MKKYFDMLKSFIILLSVMLLSIIFSIWFIYYRAMQEVEYIDEILPDYLDNVSGYITAGYSPILALKTGLREEFGVLNKTLNAAAIKALGPGHSEMEILNATSELGSEKLQRILTIFLTSYISGGKVGTMLERVAKDLRESNDLKKKLVTGVGIYIIFISISLILILPLIMSVSITFLKLGMESVHADTNGMIVLSMLMLTITSMLTGMFIGVIRYGREMMGFRHSLVLAIASNIMFFIYLTYFIPLFISA